MTFTNIQAPTNLHSVAVENDAIRQLGILEAVVNVSSTILLLFVGAFCTVLFAGNPRSPRNHAVAKITVQSSEAKPYDQSAGPALSEIQLNETFTGNIDGESPVRALQVRRDDQCASLVSMQRFNGKLGGRQGSFVLQGQDTVEKGKIKATWFVVPGSGTGDLSGLRGEGAFEGDLGKGSEGTLDYWLE